MRYQVVPTHKLLFGELRQSNERERQAISEAILVAIEFAEQIRIPIDIEELAKEYPTLADRIQEIFVKQSTKSTYPIFVSDIHDAVVDIVEEILTLPTWHRTVSIGSIRLVRNQTAFVEYNSDHQYLYIDSTINAAIVEDIQQAFADYNAGLLPAEELVEWEQNDTTYKIEPPSLCVSHSGWVASSNICFDLSDLNEITVDDTDLRINIDWHSTSGGRLGSAVAKVMETIGGDPPELIIFDDKNTYNDVKESLKKISKLTGANIETDQ